MARSGRLGAVPGLDQVAGPAEGIDRLGQGAARFGKERTLVAGQLAPGVLVVPVQARKFCKLSITKARPPKQHFRGIAPFRRFRAGPIRPMVTAAAAHEETSMDLALTR